VQGAVVVAVPDVMQVDVEPPVGRDDVPAQQVVILYDEVGRTLEPAKHSCAGLYLCVEVLPYILSH